MGIENGFNLNNNSKKSKDKEEDFKGHSRREFLKNFAKISIGTLVTGSVLRAAQKETEKEIAPYVESLKEKFNPEHLSKPEEKSEIESLELEETNLKEEKKVEESNTGERKVIGFFEYKSLKPKITPYKEIYPEIEIRNLNMLGKTGNLGVNGPEYKEGMLLRALRWKNITDAVEYKYNLPNGLILAMIMEETTGMDLLLNANGDGGAGLCHMQRGTGKEYGLNIFMDCDEIVCNCGAADALKRLIDRFNSNRKEIFEYDDRLHPIYNLDAVGRMLAVGISRPKDKLKKQDRFENLGHLRISINLYSGPRNYNDYWRDVCKNMLLLQDKYLLQNTRAKFNQRNPNLLINGEKGDFDKYIQAFHKDNFNYGLGEYINLPKYRPENSDLVLETYRRFVEKTGRPALKKKG